MSHDIESQLGFLARDITYDTVKPYSLRFTPPDSSPRHNLHIEEKKVTIHDARLIRPTIQENGFTFTSFPTEMRYIDFNEHGKIENVYASELETHLKSLFQARHVRVIDYVVRDFISHSCPSPKFIERARFDGVTLTSLSQWERSIKINNQQRWYILV